MAFQKQYGASNKRNRILRERATAVTHELTTTRKAPVSTIVAKPTLRPTPVVKSSNIVRSTPPRAVPTTSTPPPSLPPPPPPPPPAPPTPPSTLPPSTPPPPPLTTAPPTVLPPPTANIPVTTSTSTSATSSIGSLTSQSNNVLPSASTAPIVAVITSAAPTSSATATATGSISTGALVGSIVGGCATLGLIAAGVFLFLRRRRQKKKRFGEAFSSTEFRRSGVLLDEGEEKHQLPNLVTRYVQNSPVHNTNYHVPAAGYNGGEQAQHDDPFAAQASHRSAYPGPQNSQPSYAYPPTISPYVYNNPHGYPPPAARYPSHPKLAAEQNHTAFPPSHYTHSVASLSSARRYDAMPSTQYARSETSLLSHPEPGAPLDVMAHDAASAVHSRHSMENDEDAPPPAYEISDAFVNHRPDVKTRHLTYDPTRHPGGSGSGVTPIVAPVSAFAGPSTEPPSPLFSGPSREHTLSSRPVSGTSAFTIVYENER